MRRLTAPVTAAGTALVAGLLAASPAPAAPYDEAKTPPASVVPRLDWQPCGEGLEAFECATAEVPTDYDRPRGATTTIALTRLPAADPSKRVGSLFTNPGGPGGPGVGFVQSVGQTAYSQAVRDRYDIIGFDPRAVGASDPATCYRDEATETAALADLPGFPVTRDDARSYIVKDAALAAACKKTSGDRISHSSTANVARDMDLLRRAVGDKKLSYVGYSYGTFLGATYARLFPRNVGRFVLDGTLDPAAYSGTDGDRRSLGARTGQGPASAEVFDQFLSRCADAGERCALNALGEPRAVVDQMFDDLKKTPVDLPLPDGTTTTVDYASAVVVSFQSLYDPAGWSDLATTLAYLARDGEGELPAAAPKLLRRADRERGEDYTSVGSSLASSCVDSPSRLRPSQYQRLADAEDRRAPDFGRFRAWVGVECAQTRFVDRDAYRGPWKQTTDQEVLVIGTRFDPATPYDATAPYARSFPRGRMLTVEGFGHTILGKGRCADDVVTRYLVDGKTPARGATCDQDVAPFTPASPTQERLSAAVLP